MAYVVLFSEGKINFPEKNNIIVSLLVAFIFSWSLINVINFCIELKLKRFNIKDLKGFAWIGLIWIVSWTGFYLFCGMKAPANILSFDYKLFAYGQGFLLLVFAFLSATLWPLVMAFFKPPSFKRELIVLIISMQFAVLLTIAFYLFH